jgi:hypothetical protein
MSETPKLTAKAVAKELDVTPRRVRQLKDEQGLPMEPEWEDGRPRLVIGREPLDEWIERRWRGNSRRWRGGSPT